MSGRTVVLTLVLLLTAPAVAAAKGVQDARACGAAECVEAITPDTYLVFEGGPTVGAPSERAPFYVLRYKAMTGDGPAPEMVPFKVDFVPSAGLLRGEDGTWRRPDGRAAEALARHLAGVKPFPAAKLDLPGVPRPEAAKGGVEPAPIVAALLLGLGAAVLAAGARRRRRPAAG